MHNKVLKPLYTGDVVRMQPTESNSKLWKQATVSKILDRRTYEVTTEQGRSYRRNRRLLRKSGIGARPASETNSDCARPQGTQSGVCTVNPPEKSSIIPPADEALQNAQGPATVHEAGSEPEVMAQATTASELVSTTASAQPYITRSGRCVKTVEKLNM